MTRDLPTIGIVWHGIPLTVEYEWDSYKGDFYQAGWDSLSIYTVYSPDGAEIEKLLTGPALAQIEELTRVACDKEAMAARMDVSE